MSHHLHTTQKNKCYFGKFSFILKISQPLYTVRLTNIMALFITRQVAERVAAERDESCGGNSSVGFQIRLERYVYSKWFYFNNIAICVVIKSCD